MAATAHKIARTVYTVLKKRVQYEDIGVEADEQKQHERELAYPKKKAARRLCAAIWNSYGQSIIEPRTARHIESECLEVVAIRAQL